MLSRRLRQQERLSASIDAVHLLVCLSSKCKNAIFSKTKQFRAMVSIDDLSLIGCYVIGLSKYPLLDP